MSSKNKGVLLLALLPVFVSSCKEMQAARGRAVGVPPQGAGSEAALIALAPDAPVILVRQFTGRRWGIPPQTGLRLAVWEDGFVLCGAEDAEKRESLQVGHIEPTVVQDTLEKMKRLGFFELPSQLIWAPDASWTAICARHGGVRNVLGWDGISRPWEYGGFERKWLAVRNAVDRCKPRVVQPFESAADANGSVRGLRAGDINFARWFDCELWYVAGSEQK